MLLHLLYVIAFTVLAFLAMSNLIRNLMTLGMESQRSYSSRDSIAGRSPTSPMSRLQSVPHPELLDSSGNVINEPLLIMRSMSVEDAREQLDALYNASPGSTNETRDES